MYLRGLLRERTTDGGLRTDLGVLGVGLGSSGRWSLDDGSLHAMGSGSTRSSVEDGSLARSAHEPVPGAHSQYARTTAALNIMS